MARTWTVSQEAAINLRGSAILVSAAAGSGKTSVLTERIIRSLTDPHSPADLSRLLVVTFTRAAAAELKARIAAALTDALAEDPSNKRLSRQLLLLGSAQISTIDSFFQRTVRANFERLGLPATFRIADETEILPLSMEVMDGLIEEFYDRYPTTKNSSNALDKLKGNRFAAALDHLMSNRSDGKLNTCLLEFLQEFSSYPEGIGLLKRSAKQLHSDSARPFFQTVYGETLAKNMQAQFEGYIKDLLEIQASLEYDPDIAYKCSALLASDLAFCHEMETALAQRDYERAQSVVFSFIGGRFPTIKNKPQEVDRYRNWRTAFRKELTERLQPKLMPTAEAISMQAERTAELCEVLYEFYAEYEARLMVEKNARGILEHNDVRTMLYRLLTDESGDRSEFAKQLSDQYDAVYIDEYQDVDLVQDRIFALIGGNKRFMVGDIKQSIYGFRGSDPSIFAAYRRAMPLYTEAGAKKDDGVCVFMSDNFRCDRPVIEFTNLVCSFLFSACEESVGYRPQDDLVCSKRMSTDVPANVTVAVFEKDKTDGDENEERNAEAVWTAAEISRLLREEHLDDGKAVQPEDIVILVRARAQGEAFVSELKKLNIPVISETASSLLKEPILTDLLNLLRAVDNPYRDLPLSEFLLSPLGGFDLGELTELREGSSDHAALFDAMTAENGELSPALQQKVQDTLVWLEMLRDRASVLPADRFLRELYREERLLPYADLPCLLALYDQARLYQRTSWCGLYGFLRHVDKLLESGKLSANGFAKAEQAVTVMTIHHSKGLEYPVVFLAGCGSAFNRSDTYETLLFHKSVGCASKLYDAETGENENTVLRDAVRQEIDAEQTEEGIRTLYVALTRARERLYTTGTLRTTMEKAISNARAVRRGNRYAILSCNSFLAWILAALQQDEANAGDFPCTFRHFLSSEVTEGTPWKENTSAVVAAKDSAVADDTARHYAAIKQAHATFTSPLEVLHGLPTKVAASKISENLLDLLEGDNQEALETRIELMRAATPTFDRLLKEKATPSATDIGTATHSFLEFCDFRLLYENGITSETDRLVALGFIGKETAKLLHREQLEAFRAGDLLQTILEAKEVRREQKFSMLLPMSCLTQNPLLQDQLKEHTVFVQGSIDLLLTMPDGRLLLVDYKTDRVLPNEYADEAAFWDRMRASHQGQLDVYAQAVKMLFGKAPDATFIYSMPLGKACKLLPVGSVLPLKA